MCYLFEVINETTKVDAPISQINVTGTESQT